MSFSFAVREKIRERAHNTSELPALNHEIPNIAQSPFYIERPCECSHLYHGREIAEYDNSDNSVYCTDIQHYAYHHIFRDSPYMIGLQKEQNQWAIEQLYKRITRFNYVTGLSSLDLKKEIEYCRNLWFLYLGIEM